MRAAKLFAGLEGKALLASAAARRHGEHSEPKNGDRRRLDAPPQRHLH